MFFISYSGSQYFKYVFPDGVDTVIVKVSSEMTFPCSVMSIQDIQVKTTCPRTLLKGLAQSTEQICSP